MYVLSLFDGKSGCRQALEREGIKVDKYFASEIDKYAIQVTMANYPDTVQLGSVLNVDVSELPKIDLLAGGSPCQSFSFAGKRKGMAAKTPTKKQLSDLADLKNAGYKMNDGEFLATEHVEIYTLEHYLQLKSESYEFEGQSYLFWEFMRILTDARKINPDIKFLLENVMMGDKWERVLSKAIGVNPIEINSSLVSAQNRRRLYWTNIGMEPAGFFGDLASVISQPKDRGILLKDILEPNVDEKYFLSEKAIDRSTNNPRNRTVSADDDKTGSLQANQAKQSTDSIFVIESKKVEQLSTDNITEQNSEDLQDLTERELANFKQGDEKSVTLLSSMWKGAGNNGMTLVASGTLRTHKDGEGFREVKSGKGATVPARAREDGSGQNVVSVNSRIRRLTPLECERLQTVEDGYTAHVSDSQRYKMLGNGWTIEVIRHIFSYLPNEFKIPQE